MYIHLSLAKREGSTRPHVPEQLVDFKTSDLPLANCLRQCLSIYSTNLYEGVKYQICKSIGLLGS